MQRCATRTAHGVGQQPTHSCELPVRALLLHRCVRSSSTHPSWHSWWWPTGAWVRWWSTATTAPGTTGAGQGSAGRGGDSKQKGGHQACCFRSQQHGNGPLTAPTCVACCDWRVVLPARLSGLMALGYIAAFSETLALAVIAEKGLEPLCAAVAQESEDHLRAAAAWSLGQVGRHTPDHAKAVADTGARGVP